jgi:hypothetical protein
MLRMLILPTRFGDVGFLVCFRLLHFGRKNASKRQSFLGCEGSLRLNSKTSWNKYLWRKAQWKGIQNTLVGKHALRRH